ncbi:dihydroorotate dehydrogenase [Candidatus Peribacteria bacterium RIFOXYC2_FULL_55_14]|nr:MAG: Zinc/iron permease [Candidatus Peregrinibacteria bacterium GW2011_GWA2_54_9]OGJ71511.1 MAG: dihydroorotate dehydrogenase [Candidatus Peribacteria bacterium RIFOXYA1_FULL_56_14]OGJ72904.1 MAG: dihydroorotate dehydrogenase [Candidatus Peribacteria bacterium RIFOXYA2_FULL_55_28]OGJ74804.1 MAG: dihydroorotate dehydrogenase [Candidatus Peribacteria bacterium RIFOXYB1_FULL_54_35]OGJ76070.1 MAG: dihydroorotate dehydrogenase [Candidatus Peribacteria bacterium RIFOXYB2_FULL_54_17]OGJ78199.1 MAG
MLSTFANLHPVAQALIATLFTWGLTALGASLILFVNTMNRKILDAMLAFTGGVMIAASFWSLLEPAIEMSASGPFPRWVPAAVGFTVGGLFIGIIDRTVPHLHLYFPMKEAEGIHTTWRKTTLLILAITIHNIPEGLAVGVAFGALAAGVESATLTGAIALAVGIGIQNFPEGFAVAAPLRREGISRRKSFWYGQLSATVEPLAGVLGAAAVILMQPLLPYALAFAAGAMIFVVVEEVIPESQRAGNTDIATTGAMLGFLIMMTLDVALG